MPDAPTGLTATVVGHAVAIVWTPPTSGGTPSGYRLEAGYAPGAANAAVLNTTAPGFAAAGVPAATYYVRVRAFNARGRSGDGGHRGDSALGGWDRVSGLGSIALVTPTRFLVPPESAVLLS